MREYYNTTSESGSVLAQSQRQARDQKRQVLAYFEAHPGRHIAPHEIPVPSGTPLTSVRRALSNLTEEGLLEKTDQMVPGLYGKRVHAWRLASGQLEMFGVAS